MTVQLFSLTKRYFKCEDAAVTVDWVVLTAGVAGLGVLLIGVLLSTEANVAQSASDHIETSVGELSDS